jgi:hypothetical protein
LRWLLSRNAYRSGFDATAWQAASYRVRRRDCYESPFASSFHVTLEALMDSTFKIQQLYSELSAMENALKDFVKPRSANHPYEWTQEEAEKHLSLIKHRNDIVAGLTQLEGGHL